MENQIKKVNDIKTLLKFTYGIIPIVAGADKFTNLLTDWSHYLSPAIQGMLPFSGHVFMIMVGTIEIVAGILVFINTQKGAYLVCASSSVCEGAARPRSCRLPPDPQTEARMAEAVRVDAAPRLDGTLGDRLWELAKPIMDFRQREPREGEPATEKTKVRILYTRHAVYFGIHCYDSARARIVATELRRDVSQDLDDHFEILINSNHDRRSGYVFEINPLGTQGDGLIVEEQSGAEGTDFDSGWDGVWISEARIGQDGWTATIEIPFSTLNFTKSKDVIWGLNFKRFVRRKSEEDLWAAYRRTYGIVKVSEA